MHSSTSIFLKHGAVTHIFSFSTPSFAKSEFVVWPFQGIGILLVSFIALLFLLGVFVPTLYSCFVPTTKVSDVDEKPYDYDKQIKNIERNLKMYLEDGRSMEEMP